MKTMIVYLFDLVTGLFAGEAKIECTAEGFYSLQSGMTEEPPPECPPGFYAVRGQMGWATVAAEELRRAAYVAEADVFRDQAISYDEEAKALLDEEDEKLVQEAHRVTLLAAEARANYIAAKRAIRERFPEGIAAARLTVVQPAAPDDGMERYAVMPTGTYHFPSCSCVTDTAELMTPDEIASGIPDAKPCGRCNPPAIVKEASNE